MLTKTRLEQIRDSLEPGERRLVWDSEVAGFGARVSENRITFLFNYRHGPVERRMTLGTLAELGTVAAARAKAATLKLQVRAGSDPLAEIREKRKAVEARLTLASAAAMWIDSNPQWRPNTRDTYRNSLAKHVLPRLGKHDLDGITRAQWAKLLTDIRKASPSTAHMLHGILNALIGWCVDHEMIAASKMPSAKRVAPKGAVRERVLTDEEVLRIWTAADALRPRQKAFVRFVILSAMRSGEAAETRREWIQDGAIMIPAESMKGKAEHRVALSPWAWEQISTPVVGPHLFKPLGNASELLVDLRKRTGIADMRFHDLRRSVRSFLAKHGVGRDAAETVLAHRIHRDAVDKAYQRHRFEEEAEVAFHRWQSHVQALVTGGDAAKVVQMRRRRAK
jgi:integrase